MTSEWTPCIGELITECTLGGLPSPSRSAIFLSKPWAGGVSGGGWGGRLLLKIEGGGGGYSRRRRGGGKRLGGCLRRGGGAKYIFSGPKFPLNNRVAP